MNLRDFIGEARRKGATSARERTFLGRLACDSRGNMLAIMAAAMIPFCGLVGGGIDLSRMYITKTRLQHACDAGALAGRKRMGAGTWTANSNAANAAAEQFFDANFASESYGSSGLTKSFTENAGKVTGTASATLPMTLMRVLGKRTETLTVTCDAEMRLPNTDIMFVLDTTGSMASKAVSTDTDTKIQGLHTAVKCFYEIVARLDTDAACTTGTPSGGTGNQVQIRFGFVPYATNVNVGRLLPTAYVADSWTYQSREPEWDSTTTTNWSPGVAGNTTSFGPTTSAWSGYVNGETTWRNAQGGCTAPTSTTSQPVTTTTPQTTPVPAGSNAQTYQQTTSTVVTESRYTSTPATFWGIQYCQVQVSTRTTTTGVTTTYTQQRLTSTSNTFKRWHYGPVAHDISGLKNGNDWNASLQLPIGSNGTMQTVDWEGCIEERSTVRETNYSPIPAGAKDLDIDLIPTAGDQSTLWAPALPSAIYTRSSTISTLTNNALDLWASADKYTTLDYAQNAQYFCPEPARKLQSWADATAFSDYVDSLQPEGNTYHDIGLLWGARFMSPTGLFASENALTPQGGEIERNLIFMTDGDTVTQNYDYTAYGVPWFDRRQTPANQVPNQTQLTEQVNLRFLALCDAVKNKNITLWVISFGNGSNATTEGRLEQCATSGRYFVARDSATLQSTFQSIANQISQLRLTK